MLDGGWILERFGTSVSRLYAKAVSRSSNAYIIHGETFSRQTLPFWNDKLKRSVFEAKIRKIRKIAQLISHYVLMPVCIGFTNTESYLSHEAEVNERLCVYEEKRNETAKRRWIGDEKNATGSIQRRSIISLIMRNTEGCSGYRSRQKPLAKALLAAGKTTEAREEGEQWGSSNGGESRKRNTVGEKGTEEKGEGVERGSWSFRWEMKRTGNAHPLINLFDRTALINAYRAYRRYDSITRNRLRSRRVASASVDDVRQNWSLAAVASCHIGASKFSPFLFFFFFSFFIHFHRSRKERSNELTTFLLNFAILLFEYAINTQPFNGIVLLHFTIAELNRIR